MAGIRTGNQIYEVGIYCRLSKDDGTDNESASIATQKSILTDYVKKQGWHLAKTYVDDGYSGTNFQRPSFQNMIKDIENGLINCVITKAGSGTKPAAGPPPIAAPSPFMRPSGRCVKPLTRWPLTGGLGGSRWTTLIACSCGLGS